MADKGIASDKEAQESPENNFLYLLKCELQDVKKEIDVIEAKWKTDEDGENL